MTYRRLTNPLKSTLAIATIWIVLLNSAYGFTHGAILHTFNGNPDGSPESLILDAAGNIYGTAIHGNGSVFKLSPNANGGYDYSALYEFQGGADGAIPVAVLMDSNGNLFGTTSEGGANSCIGGFGCGTVFELMPTPSGPWIHTVIYNFGSFSGDGATPVAGVTLDGAGNLYGTTSGGGTNDEGTAFELSPSAGGWMETILHSFSNSGGDGCLPQSPVTLDNQGNLYGMTYACGSFGAGIVYQLTPTSGGVWSENILHSFQGGSDGQGTYSGLTLDSAGNLYGTTVAGGVGPECHLSLGCGVVFELSPVAGGAWTESILHRFRATTDGAVPYAAPVFDASGRLYGTTSEGGTNGNGVVFRLTPISGGRWLEKTYSFTGLADGGQPESGVVFDASGFLYGVTFTGGGQNGKDFGTVYRAKP